MKILITGAAGFLGKNLTQSLQQLPGVELRHYTRATDPALLPQMCSGVDFVFHLAGINRPSDPSEFVSGNVELTRILLKCLQNCNNSCPVLLASSILAAEDTPYGCSKRAAEELVFAHGAKTGARTLVYRLPNLFGKWCRPHYNSVIATLCHEIARGNTLALEEPEKALDFAYIDDVLAEFVAALRCGETRRGEFCHIPVMHRVALGQIPQLLMEFRDNPSRIPDMAPGTFEKKLYSTYLTYLPPEAVCTPIPLHTDSRGSFAELWKTDCYGQVSVNITKPGVTKGGHWHHSKWEQFLVVSGTGRICQRDPHSGAVLTFEVSGDSLRMVRILPGWSHTLTNLSTDADLVTLIWANESYDPDHPDTYPGRGRNVSK